jgi:hypothetical protein
MEARSSFVPNYDAYAVEGARLGREIKAPKQAEEYTAYACALTQGRCREPSNKAKSRRYG